MRNKWCAVFPSAATNWCVYWCRQSNSRATYNGKQNIFTEFQYNPSVNWKPVDLKVSLYKLYQ